MAVSDKFQEGDRVYYEQDWKDGEKVYGTVVSREIAEAKESTLKEPMYQLNRFRVWAVWENEWNVTKQVLYMDEPDVFLECSANHGEIMILNDPEYTDLFE